MLRSTRVCFPLFCCMLLLAPRASASEAAPPSLGQADEAQFHFLRGNRAYQEKRFEDALASYYLSNRLVANRNVEFNIARCLDRLGRYEEAYRAWSALLDQPLPEKELAAVKTAIEQLRPHLALVVVESTPPGATLYVERRDLGALGQTPKSLALRSGTTRIILDREGFRPVELIASPVQGQEVRLSATLERIYARIDVRRVPPQAEIRRDVVDGTLLRRGPGQLEVLPGSVVLFVSSPGYQTTRLMVDALPDLITPVDVVLPEAEAPTGILVVRANIAGALVRIDGKEAGFAPTVIDGVATGMRQVELTAEGRVPYLGAIEVKKDRRSFVDACLRHADPEVVAATKSSVASEAAPASISVITADEIAGFGYTSLAEAITAIRGTFSSNDRSYESVGFRGFSPPGDYTNRVLVLVDGHLLNDAVTGQGYVGHDLDVDLANVARIEIVRGPGSVLYGTGAIFGVINLVTRRPAEGNHGAVSTMGGTMGLLSARGTASARKGPAELMLSAAAMRTEGERRFAWPAEVDTQPDTLTAVFDADRERAAHVDLVGRLGSLSLRAGYNDRKKDLPTGAYDSAPAAGTYNHDRRGYAELRVGRSLSGLGLSARASYDLSWYQGRFNGESPADLRVQDLKAQWLTGELRLQIPRRFRQSLTLGAELVKQLELETDEVAPGRAPIPKDLIVSLYIVDTIALSHRLTVDLGLRSDTYTESFGSTLNPRFALIGKPYAKGNTKVFVGRSFRVPSPEERAGSVETDLGPETIWSGEIEHKHALTEDVQIIGSVFANWLYHLVNLQPAPDIAPYHGSGYQNSGHRVRSLGAEAEIRWEPGGGTLVSVSATRQSVVELGETNRAFVNAPQTMIKVRVLCPLIDRRLRLGSEVVVDSGRHFDPSRLHLASSDNQVDDAVLWNLGASGDFPPLGARYFLGILNLLDVRQARAGFPTAIDNRLALVPRYGRSVRLGLGWTF